MSTAPRGTEAGEKPFWLARITRTVFFFAVMLTLAGAYLALKVPISVFPNTNFPRVVIGVDNGVMPVEQMEVTITKPIEDAVNSVPGLVTVRSNTSRGSAEVSLFFTWDVDMYRELQLVDAALSKVEQTLPPTARITTNRLTFATFPILGYSLTSDTVPQTRLWEIATYDLKPPLNRVMGVSTVVVQGGQVPEFHVTPNLAQLAATGVTVTDLVNAIEASNIVESPGLYEANHELILGLVGAQVHNTDELRQLVVKTTPGGAPVRVADVATVEPATLPVYTTVTANGKAAVLLNIARQPSSNTVKVADAVAAEVAQLRYKLPPGVTMEPFYDQSQLVRDAIASVRDAIFIGLILACIVLFLFLRDWSSSLVAGLVIPVTVAVTVLVLWAIGQSFNLMTLGGLAAAIGLVIDDAIVVVENIVLHRDSGEPRASAVRKALAEITTPLVGSTITPVVVFLPLVAVTGVTGSFFRALAITMTAALLTTIVLHNGVHLAGSQPVVFAKSILITVAVTTAVWLATTFLTAPEPDSTLIGFYRKVRPDALGWRHIAEQVPELPPVHDSWYNLLDWVLGCLMVYMVLFGVGKLLLGDTAVGVGFLVVSALSGGAIYWDFSRRGWETLSGKKLA